MTPGRGSSGIRSAAAGLALIPLGIVLGLFALELILQIGALYIAASGQDLGRAWTNRLGRRVLCLGDSNTYGAYLRDRNRAYPQQLERLWNERVRTPPIEVLNLGYPGTNSSVLRNNFSEMLDGLSPDVVIVMVGANDYWTMPVALDESPGLHESLRRFVRRNSRVVKLVYMLRRSLENSEPAISFSEGDREGKTGQVQVGSQRFRFGWQRANRLGADEEALRSNLHELVREAASAGTELVLMTYPSRIANYGEASVATRNVAQTTQTRLVDLAPVFAESCPKEPCPELLLPDHHPNANGYRLIAETLVRELWDDL